MSYEDKLQQLLEKTEFLFDDVEELIKETPGREIPRLKDVQIKLYFAGKQLRLIRKSLSTSGAEQKA